MQPGHCAQAGSLVRCAWVPRAAAARPACAALPSMVLSYVVTDVFTDTAFGGNQLAVVFGAEELSTEEMLSICRECAHVPIRMREARPCDPISTCNADEPVAQCSSCTPCC